MFRWNEKTKRKCLTSLAEIKSALAQDDNEVILTMNLRENFRSIYEYLVQLGFSYAPEIQTQRGKFFSLGFNKAGICEIEIQDRLVKRIKRSLVLIDATGYSRGDITEKDLPDIAAVLDDNGWHGASAAKIGKKMLRPSLYGSGWFAPLSVKMQLKIEKAYYGFSWNWDRYGDVEHEEKDVTLWDIHSAYPYLLVTSLLPYGTPIESYGFKPMTSFWIAEINFACKLKPQGIPFLPLEKFRNPMTGCVTLEVCSIDWDNICMNYDLDNVEFFSTWSFKLIDSRTAFQNRILPLFNYKESLPHGVKRDVVKTILETFYGAYGQPIYRTRMTFDPDHMQPVSRKISSTQLRQSGGYLPVAIYIVAKQRFRMMLLARKYPNIIHICVDSLQFKGPVPEEFIRNEVGTALGQFGQENGDAYYGRYINNYQYALFDRQKQLVKIYWGGNDSSAVNYDNYHKGVLIPHALKQRINKGKFKFITVVKPLRIGGQAFDNEQERNLKYNAIPVNL